MNKQKSQNAGNHYNKSKISNERLQKMSATSYSSGRQNSTYGKLPAAEKFSSTAPSALNIFPPRGDVIKRTFINQRKRLPKLESESEKSSGYTGLFGSHPPTAAGDDQWLSPDKISDPSFGIRGNTNKDELSKSYRRIVSSTVFARPSNKDVPLNSLHEKKTYTSTYVLVEESRLQELIKLDEALQRERELLGQQCSQLCSDYQISARIPIPATRYAIYSLCQQQMHNARTEIMKLQVEWSIFCRKNH